MCHGVDIYHASGIEIWGKINASEEEKLRWKAFVEKLHYAVYMNDSLYDYDELHEEAKQVIILFYKRIEQSKRRAHE